jgi:hypothetical protein
MRRRRGWRRGGRGRGPGGPAAAAGQGGHGGGGRRGAGAGGGGARALPCGDFGRACWDASVYLGRLMGGLDGRDSLDVSG